MPIKTGRAFERSESLFRLITKEVTEELISWSTFHAVLPLHIQLFVYKDSFEHHFFCPMKID